MSGYGLIQDESVNRLLRKRLNTIPGFSQVTPELMPVFVIEGAEPDHEFLKGISLNGGLAVTNAVAGQLGNAVLWNPTGSGLLVTVQRFALRSSAAAEIIGGVVALATDRTTLTRTGPRDTRLRVDGVATTTTRARVSWDTTAAALVTTASNGQLYHLNAVAQVWFDIPFVLSPGFALAFSCQLVNTAMQVSFVWKERPLNPSELV